MFNFYLIIGLFVTTVTFLGEFVSGYIMLDTVSIYEEAIKIGASGGKIIGSGGGGFLLMYCEKRYHSLLKKRLYKLPIISFDFVNRGSEIIFKT